ncbi:Family of unknown function (DUF500) [Seminavis robusta]|uniref:Ysc84 actin-binding domain-containing protein n=1 Tax=Seminavis robusta TaxID=568900 RepID=A0A9N8H3B7_9STRA|nr:Family of unknown function (DUF500) [Seminavis robusta]|eukprot:Sro23_g015940.1 Family of unknown function (DUF500) (148) ;mRNA; f:114630-115073
MDEFKNLDSLKPFFDTAYGFVVFGSVAKAGVGVGGAAGSGTVYVNNKNGTETCVGISNLVQLSVGIQLGGQVFSEIIFFETEKDFQAFTAGNFELGADASVVVLTAHVNVDLHYSKGLATFVTIQGGLMYEVSISGQKFTYTPSVKG